MIIRRNILTDAPDLPAGAQQQAYRIRVATEAWELRGYARLRRQTFCEEQRLFADSDHDEHDLLATPIVAVSDSGFCLCDVVGCVRIFPSDGRGEMSPSPGTPGEGREGADDPTIDRALNHLTTEKSELRCSATRPPTAPSLPDNRPPTEGKNSHPSLGEWYGSRLAVAPEWRGSRTLAAGLIRAAVCTAHARGCTRFLATVQEQNVLLFGRLHWVGIEEVMVRGHRHQLMQADLRFYPPADLSKPNHFLHAGAAS